MSEKLVYLLNYNQVGSPREGRKLLESGQNLDMPSPTLHNISHFYLSDKKKY